jgi:hypothetical protein
MAIGFQSTGGGDGSDILPIIKFDARAGKVFRVDRQNDGAGWTTDTVEIEREQFAAVFDMENIEVGWQLFAAGQAPDFRMVPLGASIGPRPTENHKEGFRILVKLGKDCGGDVRELASTAGVVKQALSDLHTAYELGAKENPGKLPVVKLKKTTPVKSGSGSKTSTNYAPVWEIGSWVSRPADLVAKPRGAPANGNGATATQATPPSTGSTVVAPPTAKVLEPAGAEDFG